MAEMWKTTRPILVEALRDFPRSWRRLVAADVAWKAFAFALLTPGTILLLRIHLSRHSDDVIADAEIARTLLTTVPGILSLVVGAVVLAAITALEVTCLMAIGFAGADGKRLGARQALLFAVTNAPRVLGLDGAHGRARPRRPPAVRPRGRPRLLRAPPAPRHQLLPRPAPGGVLGGRRPRRRPRGRAPRPSRPDRRPLGLRAADRPLRGRPPVARPRGEPAEVGGGPRRDPLRPRGVGCGRGPRPGGRPRGCRRLPAALSRRTSAARWRGPSRSSSSSRRSRDSSRSRPAS